MSSFGDGTGSGYWRLPGYGDFLERDDPEIRRRNADLGAPDRFEDAVATIEPLGDDETPPHWSVTFGVDDADTAAARAALGGTVVVPPTDAPWVRATVAARSAGCAVHRQPVRAARERLTGW